MESIKINSCINVYHIPMTKLKTTTVGIYLHRPLCEDEVSLNAILPYVLKRGCTLCPDNTAVAEYLENLYGARMGAYTMKLGDDHIIYLGLETISDKYAPEGEKLTEGIIKLAMSLLFEPVSFTDDILEQEKNNARDRIMAEINEKGLYAMRRCGEEMCKGDRFALSVLGTVDGVDKITADSLKKHYESIINSSVIDIYICGECDIDAAAESIKQYTESVAFKTAELPQSKIFSGSGEIKNVTEKLDVAQGKLSIGFRTNVKPTDNDYIPLMVFNSIFGGGAHSKLFNNVREKLSLCYYASSSLVKNKGIMFVNAGIEFKNFEKAYNEILAQLKNIQNGEISELEFTSGVRAIQNELEAYKDNQHMMQVFYLGQRVSGTDMDVDTLKEKIGKVTADDVISVSKKVAPDTVYFLTGKEEK